MLKISYAGCLVLSLAISSQFSVEMCVEPGNAKKFTKTLILGVPGHSRSLTLTQIKSLSLLLVMISSISVSICNRFHAT